MTSRTILIAVVAGLILTLAAAASVTVAAAGISVAATQSFFAHLTDTLRVNRMAERIADFDLPTGYRADYAVEVLDYTVVAYKSAEGNGHLALIQAPPGILPSGATLDSFIANSDDDDSWSDATPVRNEARTVRDQPAMLSISDRTNDENMRYRSLNLIFEGRAGTVLLVLNQPLATWDDDAVEAFIASIH